MPTHDIYVEIKSKLFAPSWFEIQIDNSSLLSTVYLQLLITTEVRSCQLSKAQYQMLIRKWIIILLIMKLIMLRQVGAVELLHMELYLLDLPFIIEVHFIYL